MPSCLHCCALCTVEPCACLHVCTVVPCALLSPVHALPLHLCTSCGTALACVHARDPSAFCLCGRALACVHARDPLAFCLWGRLSPAHAPLLWPATLCAPLGHCVCLLWVVCLSCGQCAPVKQHMCLLWAVCLSGSARPLGSALCTGASHPPSFGCARPLPAPPAAVAPLGGYKHALGAPLLPHLQDPILAPVRTRGVSPSKARSDVGAVSSPSTHCSSPLFEVCVCVHMWVTHVSCSGSPEHSFLCSKCHRARMGAWYAR